MRGIKRVNERRESREQERVEWGKQSHRTYQVGSNIAHFYHESRVI
jgi:hypothetical protein